MLRRIRMPELTLPWWAPMLPPAAAAGAAFLGAGVTGSVRLIAISGLFSGLAAASLRRQISRHERHHHRMDRQHGVMASVVRFTFRHDGTPVPPALADEREEQPGVVAFRPRAGAPRHRAQSRRRNA